MSLENFQIPVLLLPELYKDSLVQLDIPQASADKLEETELFYLGNNKKNILVLVNETDAVHLKDANMELLSNILNACKLNMNDICLLNVNQNNKVLVTELLTRFHTKSLLVFGTLPDNVRLPESFNAYENKTYQNCSVLLVDSLEKIAADPELKKSLWRALKSLFHL